MNTTLASNLEIIFNRFSVDEVFFWTYSRNDIIQYIVQVHTRDKQRSRNRVDRCVKLLSKMDDHQFMFYNTREVQSRINNGHAPLYFSCQPNNRIYLNPKHKNTVSVPDMSTAALKDRTNEFIKSEKDRILSFIDGFRLYYDNQNYANAAFMLHQALEISLRTAQKLLLGIERRSHSTKQNMDYFKPYDTGLSNLCSNPEEELAINRLTESYIGSRYRSGFVMEPEQIECCEAITWKVIAWIENYEMELLQEIEERHVLSVEINHSPETTTTENMKKPTNINNNHRDLIINALETYGQVHGVYCFAYLAKQDNMCNLLHVQQSHNEMHHYYLFAIMSNQNRPIMDLQNCIMNLLPEKVKITLIAETPEQVEKKLKKGDILVTNLLQSAESWYSDREYLKSTEQITTENIDFEDLYKSWNKNHIKSEGINLATEDIFCDLELETIAYMLSLSLEHICLGILRGILHYFPQSTNLNYLMDLCEMLCPEEASIFVRNNKEQQALFSTLVDAQNKYRHSTSFRVKPLDLEILHERVESFTRASNEFIQTHFRQLKNLPESQETAEIGQ